MNGTISWHCPLCQQESTTILTHALRRGEGKVLHCPSCDHGFLVQHKQVDPRQFYAEGYRQEYSHRAEEAQTNAREIFDVYKLYQKGRLDVISPLLHPDTRLLEVGASSGQFLWHVKDRVAQVNAIELDKACCAFLEQELKIPVDDEYLENSCFAGQRYDVVCAFQVMEHVEDPVKFLESLIQATESNGTILVEVPNLHDPLLSVWDVPAYGIFYYHSAHLHYFSEQSLRAVARAAGFADSDIQVTYTQDYNLLNHLHWIINNAPQPDCHIGLAEVQLKGRNAAINAWLSQELKDLNERYITKLARVGCTSNMMMRLRRG
jgi:2-polyprenyl-3-methyl-5-hydroxy-6-metoxy-1,4-benzoquinol methylase